VTSLSENMPIVIFKSIRSRLKQNLIYFESKVLVLRITMFLYNVIKWNKIIYIPIILSIVRMKRRISDEKDN